ncbi:hypothetical protein H0A66_02870 [Alcaligenaceae bacterium]|nr:hypothetical protein [Alcaligenaceae bacterium]
MTDDLFNMCVLFAFRINPDPINNRDHHQARINDARESLGQRYLCHPANHIKPIWRGPCQLKNTMA